jgi:8-hydroxy-5-deazaflavin:NADPH oxidoreductase
MTGTAKIGVFGTGSVGRTVGAKLAELGHAVVIGTRDPAATLARTDSDHFGNPPFKVWLEAHPKVHLKTFAEAAAEAELLVNATVGHGAIPALEAAGAANLAGKVLLDISNPLDFSKGFPPFLSVCNTDSLGEQIQRAFPELRVVKTLNTVTAAVMVNPKLVAGGDHTIFVSGNDAGAKKTATEVLQSFGWTDIVDLGDITTARGTEMYLPLWVRLMSATKTPMFSIKVVR